MVAVERVAEPVAGAGRRLLYSGAIGPLYRILLLKLLLAIPTLGFYHFWAAARERRYHLANLSCDGDPFEWTGTGGELALGFLKAAGVLLLLAVPGLVLSLLGNPLGPILAQGLPFLAIVALGPAASFWALRYRLSRTRWRGIRGALVGSGLAYALRSLGWTLVLPLTLFQAVPFRSIDLARYRVTRMRFGNVPFAFDGSVRAVFGVWLLVWTPMAAFVLLLLWAVPAAFSEMGELGLAAAAGIGILGLLALDFLGGLLLLIYVLAVYRHVLSSSSVAGLHFSTDASLAGMVGMTLLHVLLVAVSFGLAGPIATHLGWRYFARHLIVSGEIDQAVRQSPEKRPGTGEGLLEAGDVGVW